MPYMKQVMSRENVGFVIRYPVRLPVQLQRLARVFNEKSEFILCIYDLLALFM